MAGTEADAEELGRIVRDGLPRLSVIGVVEDGRVLAFAAFDSATDPVVIEYIAVDGHAQRFGHGTALVDAVRTAARGRSVYAQTDDDAVDFYRRIGPEFVVAPTGAPTARRGGQGAA